MNKTIRISIFYKDGGAYNTAVNGNEICLKDGFLRVGPLFLSTEEMISAKIDDVKIIF